MSILIDKNTRVITQGITGKTGQFHTRMCREYANGRGLELIAIDFAQTRRSPQHHTRNKRP